MFYTFLTSREIMTDDTSIISISKQYIGGNSYLMCKLSDLVINICLLHFFYLTLSKFLSLRHVSMPYFQFWRPCLLLPCKKRGDWFTGKPDVGLNYQILLTLRDEYCLWLIVLIVIECYNLVVLLDNDQFHICDKKINVHQSDSSLQTKHIVW